MILPPHRSVRLVRSAPDGLDRSAWISAIGARDWSVGAEVLKRSSDASVIRATVHSIDMVLKSRLSGGVKGSLQRVIGRSRSDRQWLGSEWLATHGIASARCLALLTGRRDGAGVETLVLEYVPGHTLLWHIARGAIAEDPMSPASRAIAYAVGTDMARLVKAGRFNRDHKPSNIVVVRSGPPTAALALVDAVAIVRFKPAKRSEAMARMIASLMIEPRGIGHPAPETFMARVVQALGHEMVGAAEAEAWSRDMLAWASRIVGSHRDPVPADDPLIGLH